MSLGKREIMRIEEQGIDEEDVDDSSSQENEQAVQILENEKIYGQPIGSIGEKQQEREQKHLQPNQDEKKSSTVQDISEFQQECNNKEQQDHIPSDQRMNDERLSYEEVSQQLQKALNKIKTQKNLQKSSFLARMQYYENKKQKNLRKNKQQLDFNQSQNYSINSLVNAKSQKILENYQPIHQRYQKCLKQKQKKIQVQKMQKLLKQQEQQERHLKKQIKLSDHYRSSQQFLQQVKKWQKIKQKKIVAKMQQSLQQQMKGITFNPQIDSKSTEIVAKKGRIPLPKREVKSKKYELDNNCTFHPNLKKGL